MNTTSRYILRLRVAEFFVTCKFNRRKYINSIEKICEGTYCNVCKCAKANITEYEHIDL